FAIPILTLQGYREQTIPGTPIDFVSLYKKCWNAEPKERPTINEILENLSLMSKKETIQFIINRNRESIPVLDAMPLLDATKEFIPVLDATDATNEHTPVLNVFDAALDATKKPTPILDTTESNISHHSKWFEQIKDSIANYGFSAFENIKVIGKGAFGVVYSAEYNGKMFALKSLDNDNVNKEVSKEFIKELRQLYDISPHPNVNQFHGITHDSKTNKFMLVLQFANGEHLRQYLQNKWHEGTYMIKLNEILKFALQVTSGKIDDSYFSSTSSLKGAPAYLDPYCYCQPGRRPDEKSDIYSLGVIFWELTSGVPPFANANNTLAILCQTSGGYREQTIPGTPKEYAKIYKKCWNAEPKERPTINKILENLNLMSKGKADRLIINRNKELIPKIDKQPQSYSKINLFGKLFN
ncbi:13258_t:CDS:2, partial [Cetraspora pellucida]